MSPLEIKLVTGETVRVEMPFAEVTDALRGRDTMISLSLNGQPTVIRVDHIVSVTDLGEASA